MSLVTFGKYTNAIENTYISTHINVDPDISGNSALANSTANASGYNSYTETLTQTGVTSHMGSSSVSESTSATSGYHFSW